MQLWSSSLQSSRDRVVVFAMGGREEGVAGVDRRQMEDGLKETSPTEMWEKSANATVVPTIRRICENFGVQLVL